MSIHRSVAIGAPILLSIFWLCRISPVLAELSTAVDIKNGTLEGIIMKSRSGRDFVAFRGIPYAQPPIGKLRFEPPKPYDSWSGVRSAKEEANVCTQRDIFVHIAEVSGDEDCLYLNVYTPMLPSDAVDGSQPRYPVMVNLHGGGFVAGAGNADTFGPQFLLDHDVVLVSPNYRLGPLGFLSTEDLVSPGNQGLKDQWQALRWVQENVAAFGGDPNSVTIFGESAGAASVHLHVVSPLSRGLFHRAISQSGSAVSPWAMSPQPGHAWNQAKRLGELLDCPTDTSAALVECLRTKSPVDLVKTHSAFLKFDYCPLIPFRPTVEPDHPGAFIREHPAESLKSGNVADVPWMTGIVTNEGAMKSSAIFGLKDQQLDKLLDEKFMELAPMSLLYEHSCPRDQMDNVTRQIREFYFGDKRIDFSMKSELTDMYTDAWFSIPTNNAVRNHLEALSSPVFYYLYGYKGSASFSRLFGDPDTDYGVCHADDISSLCPVHESLFKGTTFTDEDNRMVDLMTSLFVNFAKSGNPTPAISSVVPAKWKPVRTSRLEYLHIKNPKDITMESDLFSERVEFWANLPCRGNAELRQNRQERDEL